MIKIYGGDIRDSNIDGGEFNACTIKNCVIINSKLDEGCLLTGNAVSGEFVAPNESAMKRQELECAKSDIEVWERKIADAKKRVAELEEEK
jgi:hypothetical protein